MDKYGVFELALAEFALEDEDEDEEKEASFLFHHA
jgi:hypothetical protein